LNHDINDDAQKVNAEFKKRTGEFAFEYAGGLVAQTFMLADALERAASPIPRRCARPYQRSTYRRALRQWRLAAR